MKVFSALLLTFSLSATTLANDEAHTPTTSERVMQAAAGAQEALKKGILIGKVESVVLFNQHLRGYGLDVKQDLNAFRISGTVSTSIEKDYAEQLLYSIDGVDTVINNIKVSKTTEKKTLEDKAEKLTGTIKAKLIANPNISGLSIQVSTSNGEVQLKGNVMKKIEKELVGMIAENTPGVVSVENNIQTSE